MQQFRPSRGLRLANRVVMALVKLGIPLRGSGSPMGLLTVPGRKSGLPRTTPVALLPEGDGWRLMSPYGMVDWVKNLRAAGSANITWRGRKIVVTAHELTPAEAAPVLRDVLARAPRMLRKAFAPYFDTPASAPLTEWEVEAERHPVFHLQQVEDSERSAV